MILVLEDDQLFSELISTVLKDMGKTAVRVHRLKDAMCLLHSLDFDAAIVDLGLTDGNGFDLVQAMRERGMRNKVMVITGCEAAQIGNVLAEIEKDDQTKFFQKPVSLDQFRSACAQL